MKISNGQKLPDARFTVIGAEGPEQVDLAPLLSGRRVLVLGMPGAFTPTCSTAHLPSVIRSADEIRAKGIDEILLISVNDPHVMRAWGEQSGASAAGITLLADAGCEFTESIGMRFDAPMVGLVARSLRYAMVVDDGAVELLRIEEGRGTCAMTGGEAVLSLL
ncbi:thiol peroxidase (atypical 2-Cys peroxiredoxin) [Aliiruegeria haliotis]|uniref:Glutathione-dependent peroxiredoxin n=1 Tax=Aliiruegeria haliotis TaxID=1280846 RepID=A0A2T0RTI1_9RHOB|nr:peroxiredoxin [Aliiruegeria haliotis]PRY24471.1 thiol peroxidase (atypical 2-Cys peroxiredoxin) [Aliiruegeria haliotis]